VSPRTRSVVPAVVIGVGLGGFLDGILLHQIAQWHNMGSAVVPPVTMEAMSRNMVWDGWFHLAVWVITIIGIFMLLDDARRGRRLPAPRVFSGLLVAGWGLFNLVEGVVNHHLLELHHVRDVPVHVPAYDWLFLGVGGIGLIVVGWLLAREA
jgi:uncharacterized membrane protein